ncbi:MAG: C39 family peptidase [Mycobacterium sp.]
MTNVLSTRVAAAVLSAAAAASTVGFAGATHAAPSNTNSQGGMHGDPAAAAPFWRFQVAPYACGEMAVADVIGQITGHEPSEGEITAAAGHTPSDNHPGPIYTPSSRTSNNDLVVLLAHYGIQAGGFHSNLDLIEQDLDHGRKVIAAVNDKTLWNESGNRGQENHFVVVTGIDTNADVVHLNDSGVAGGRDEQVSIATFDAAWAVSDHFAVVTR